MPKHRFNLKFKNEQLVCACLFGNPRCGTFKACEAQELNYNPFEDARECMDHSAYTREHGAIKQIK